MAIYSGKKAEINNLKLDMCEWRIETKLPTSKEITTFAPERNYIKTEEVFSRGNLKLYYLINDKTYDYIKEGKVILTLYGDIGPYPEKGREIYIYNIDRIGPRCGDIITITFDFGPG